MLDALTLRQHFGNVEGLRVAIVGDIRHSRVARSNVALLTTLGAEVTLVAPRTLLPEAVDGWPVRTASGLDEVLAEMDVIYLLRIQTERGGGEVFPSVSEYVSRFGLTRQRAREMKEGAVVLHPGPMNRGVEIAPMVADGPSSLVTQQVSNGLAIRMAILFDLLSGDEA